jgi:hypothetical protein
VVGCIIPFIVCPIFLVFRQTDNHPHLHRDFGPPEDPPKNRRASGQAGRQYSLLANAIKQASFHLCTLLYALFLLHAPFCFFLLNTFLPVYPFTSLPVLWRAIFWSASGLAEASAHSHRKTGGQGGIFCLLSFFNGEQNPWQTFGQIF